MVYLFAKKSIFEAMISQISKSLFALFIMLVVLMGCDDKKADAEAAAAALAAKDCTAFSKITKMPGVTYTDTQLRGAALKMTDNWIQFKTFESEIKNVLAADYGVLATELELLDKAYKELLDSEFPEKLDAPQIKSRLTVLYTFASKLADEVNSNEPIEVLEKSLTQISDAFNAIKTQMMERYESTVDGDDLIFEKETTEEDTQE